MLGGTYLTEAELKDYGFKELGHNVRIHSRASVYCPEEISIGSNVRIDDFTVIVASGGVTIGSYVHIANFCFLGGRHGIVLGDFAGLAHGVKIFTGSDDYSGEMLTNPTVPEEYTGGRSGQVALGRHVIIGSGSIVLPGCELGEGVSVGALSLVNRSLEPWGVCFGIPARRIKSRKKSLLDLEKQLLRGTTMKNSD